MIWIIFVIALVGAVLNVKEKRVCFLLWMVSNGTWLVRNWIAGDWPQAACYAIFFVVSIYGWFKWKGKAEQITDSSSQSADVDMDELIELPAGIKFEEISKLSCTEFAKKTKAELKEGLSDEKV